jgi:hypothetical protein
MFSDCSHTSAPSPCLPQALPVKYTFTSILTHVPTANGCMQHNSRPYKATLYIQACVIIQLASQILYYALSLQLPLRDQTLFAVKLVRNSR